jgi:M6 family metalloprotease-like protein
LAFPNHGTINALIIFVQNATDTGEDDCFDSRAPVINFHQFPASDCRDRQDTPELQSTTADPETEWPQGWSTGRDRDPPMWASTMLAAPGTLPANFPTGSLSQFYHLNSGGRFTLTGHVYPEVYIPAHEPSWYDLPVNRGDFENGAVKLSHDILTYVDANRHGIPLDDASVFDRYTNGTNSLIPDGKFDMVVMIFRTNGTCAYGYPQCGNAMTSLGSRYEPGDSFDSDPIVFLEPGGARGLAVIDDYGAGTGSGVWSAGSNLFLAQAVTAHEIGHRQYGLAHSTDNLLGVMSPNALHPTMFTAPDRVLLGWATEENVAYGSLATTANGRALSETFGSGTVLTVRSGSTPEDEQGDVIVEARTHTNVWDQPAGPSNPFSDGDVTDFYFQREGLLVYKRGGSTYISSYASSVENTGLVGRGYAEGALRGVIRVEYAVGDAYSPLTRMRFAFPQDSVLDPGLAITDIARSGAGFTLSLWRDFPTATGVKNLGTNYTLANHAAGTYRGATFPDDRNVARTDHWTFGGTVRLNSGLGRVWGGDPEVTLLPSTGTSLGADLEVPAGAVATLQGPPSPAGPLPVTAGVGAQVSVIGRLLADRVSFTASTASGWGGIRFGKVFGPDTPPALPSSLTGVTVSGVRYFGGLEDDPSPYPPYGAVEVRNRVVTITGGTTISGNSGVNGVMATGSLARVDVTGASDISSNSGVGVYGMGGAYVSVTGAFSQVRLNTAGGIYLNGYGTRADVTSRAQVNNNVGMGIVADNQAYARIRADGTGTPSTSVSQNVGGPTALAGGSVDGGQCTSTGTAIRPNHFVNNYQGGTSYDARAEGGSTVAARYAWWGGRDSLSVVQGKASTVSVYPVAPTQTSSDPSCQSVSEGRGMAAPPDAWAEVSYSEAGRGGPLTASVVALATEAREAAWAGDPDGAFALLTAAADSAATEDDREAVYSALGALVAEADSALSVPAVVEALEAKGDGTGPDRPWALRALAVAYAVTGQADEADAVAGGLTLDEAGADHAVFGHSVRVRLAVEVDSAEFAVARLADFAAIVTAADTAAVEAFASSLALVAASFPDADLSAVMGGPVGRGTGATRARASALGRDVSTDGVSAWPNPVSSRGTVRVTVSGPADATATVYDAVGRRVATLHDGPLAAGSVDLPFTASGLAPGVYVVVVRVSPEGGTAWTEVRRVTVAR